MTGVSDLTSFVFSITEDVNNVDSRLNTSDEGTPYINLLETAVWDLSPTGSVTGGNYGIQLFFGSMSGSLTDDNIFGILKRASGSNDYADWDSFTATTTYPAADSSGRTVASGYMQRLGYTSFSEFGGGEGASPLPIDLLNISAYCDEKEAVMISWSTASEKNNDFFTIERSRELGNWEIVTKIDGAGSSNSILSYSVYDLSPYTDISYYRLKQTDYDGSFEYSKIVSVNCNINENEVFYVIGIIPNPAINNTKIVYYINRIDKILLQLYNNKAYLVKEDEMISEKGANEFNVNFSDLMKGIYFVRIVNSSEIISAKIIKTD